MTNSTENSKVVCVVCSGKGGFVKERRIWLDENWVDCPICEGYGFTEETMTEDECRNFLLFNNYRTKIMNEFAELAEIKSISTDVLGRDLKIVVAPMPKHKRKWVYFVKSVVKFSHYSEGLKVIPKQVFYYDEKSESHDFYWEFNFEMDSILNLDGLIDLLGMVNDFDS